MFILKGPGHNADQDSCTSSAMPTQYLHAHRCTHWLFSSHASCVRSGSLHHFGTLVGLDQAVVYLLLLLLLYTDHNACASLADSVIIQRRKGSRVSGFRA